MKTFKVLGRTEKLNILTFDLKEIEAKIDTGAYTSSIDCSLIELSEDGKILKFKVLDKEHKEFKDKFFEFDSWTKTEVTSSNGSTEERYLVNLEIEIGSEIFKTDFTLANRSKMKYPILIGRKTIPRGWFVDVHNFHN